MNDENLIILIDSEMINYIYNYKYLQYSSLLYRYVIAVALQPQHHFILREPEYWDWVCP